MRTLVLGGSGMLGSALVKKLQETGREVITHSSKDCNLLNRESVENYFYKIRRSIDEVFFCAGKVGGILSNYQNQYDFLYENSLMSLNAIDVADFFLIKNFYYISSSCAYPANCKQPMREEDIFNGDVEDTNRGYATAKRLGMEMCRALNGTEGRTYISFVPCNLYGPGDDFSEKGHVFASLVKKIYEAKINDSPSIEIWGDGTPLREFLHVNDCANMIVSSIEKGLEKRNDILNIGYGGDISIERLAFEIMTILDYYPLIDYQKDKPNGMKQKLMSIQKCWDEKIRPNILLTEGIQEMIETYKTTKENVS